MQAFAYAKQRFEFTCDGSVLIGTLRVPQGSEGRPALVFEGPLTSVKEQVTGNYADALAARGFVTLAFITGISARARANRASTSTRVAKSRT